VVKSEKLKEISPGKIRRKEHVNDGVGFVRQKLIAAIIRIISRYTSIALLLAMIESIPKINEVYMHTSLLILVSIAVKPMSEFLSLTMFVAAKLLKLRGY
jgi:hypothetical protein